jgi:hypothetical protein
VVVVVVEVVVVVLLVDGVVVGIAEVVVVVVTDVVVVVVGLVDVVVVVVVVEDKDEDVVCELQSNPIECIPTSHSLFPLPLLGGIWNETDLAPPHWVFSTVVPSELQEAVCLQVEPSGMEKIKSSSVSNETETCMCEMENWSFCAQEKLGPPPLDVLTLPWMHFDWSGT